MNDGLILRSAKTLLNSETVIRWNNKHMLPDGYAWNEEGYVVTRTPFPFVKACVGLRFVFLVGKLGFREYVRQNLIALRLLNMQVNKAIVSSILLYSLKKSGFNMNQIDYDGIVAEVYALDRVPALDPNFITWRTTWFREDCEYGRVSAVVRAENSSKIDADRELMRIDEKYITEAVAAFTGFSRHRIDNYWNEKQWTKKLRTLYTLEEAYEKLNNQGIDNPTRAQLVEVSGLSLRTIGGLVKDMQNLLERNNTQQDTPCLY